MKSKTATKQNLLGFIDASPFIFNLSSATNGIQRTRTLCI